MATQKQIEANRRNAQKSTGPRTPEGKERASRNHITHGIFSRPAFPASDDPEFLDDLAGYRAEYPQPWAVPYVVLIALGTWQRARVHEAENEVWAHYRAARQQTDPALLTEAMAAYGQGLSAIDRLSGRAERTYYAGFNTLIGRSDPEVARERAQWDIDNPADDSPFPPLAAMREKDARRRFVRRTIRTHFRPKALQPTLPGSESAVRTQFAP